MAMLSELEKQVLLAIIDQQTDSRSILLEQLEVAEVISRENT